MALRSTHILLFLMMAALVAKSSAGGAHTRFAIYEPVRTSDGLTVGDFVDGDEEMGMGTESARRGLRGRGGYISYGALTANRVPCGQRGASYYNCNERSQVNPYRRGCSAITRCARILT